MPIQQMLLGGGGSGSATKTYVDDVFSTYLWAGNAASRSINNGINLSEGGLVWIKNRKGPSTPWYHVLADSVRGSSKIIRSNGNNSEYTNTSAITSFNNNGFSLGSAVEVNGDDDDETYSSWSFKETPGFFDVVTYTGTGSNAPITVNHNLGCIPGFIALKQSNSNESWIVWHQNMPTSSNAKYLKLNENYSVGTDGSSPPNASINSVSSTQIVIGKDNNTSNGEYVVYLWAGGKSEAATAKSVDFDGSGDYLSAASSSDFTLTGDFTMECWFKSTSVAGVNVVLNGRGTASSGGPVIYTNGTNLVFDKGTAAVCTASDVIREGQWYHVAGTRSGNTWKLYLNGIDVASGTDSVSYSSDTGFVIGSSWANEYFNGLVSNVRLTKGQVLYTSAFKPTTEPLTTTSQGATASNVKLLCCNNSSVTGSTVGTLSNNGNPTASTDSPFDDSAGFKFGESGDQNVIKCGSYAGSNGADSVYLGFEPQWLMIKSYSNGGAHYNWHMYDNMRGVVTGENDKALSANLVEGEAGGYNYDEELIEFTPTGFIADPGGSNRGVNGEHGQTYIYVAIRRPDGYVGKPAEAGTDVFAIDTWVSDSTPNNEANMISNFPVDFVLDRDPTASSGWQADTNARARLIQNKYLRFNDNNAEGTGTWGQFDYNNGWMNRQGYTGYTDWHSWMWKRHAGFDVVTYQGSNSAGHSIPHNLGKPPEMMIINCRSHNESPIVYHKDMNGGTNPHTYYMTTNSDSGESSWDWTNGTPPTSTHFTLGSGSSINFDRPYLAVLFASVEGISKCGGYSGDTSTVTVSCGFVPRLVIIKKRDEAGGPNGWLIFDTLRGITSGADCYLFLNSQAADVCSYDVLDLVDTPSVKGFSVPTLGSNNDNGSTYIYYAHA